MIGTVLVAVLVLAVGTRATDAVRLRQQELILAKLPTPEAAAFYGLLRRRAWKTRILRAVALVAVIVILHARNRDRSQRQPPQRMDQQTDHSSDRSRVTTQSATARR